MDRGRLRGTGRHRGRGIRRTRAAFRRLASAVANGGEETIADDLARRIADPVMWQTAAVINGLAVATVWIMTVKPDWVGSILFVAVAGVAGALVGRVMLRRGQ